MPIPAKSRFPSSLTRDQASGSASDGVRRKEPSAADIAMMDSAQYRAYAEVYGLWAEADREAIQEMRREREW